MHAVTEVNVAKRPTSNLPAEPVLVTHAQFHPTHLPHNATIAIDAAAATIAANSVAKRLSHEMSLETPKNMLKHRVLTLWYVQ